MTPWLQLALAIRDAERTASADVLEQAIRAMLHACADRLELLAPEEEASEAFSEYSENSVD